MIAALLYNNLAMTSPYWCPPSRLCLCTARGYAWPHVCKIAKIVLTFIVHCNDVIMSVMASQISNLSIVYSSVYLRRRSKKIPKPRFIGLCEENSLMTGEFPTKRSVTWKMFLFDDAIMQGWLLCIIYYVICILYKETIVYRQILKVPLSKRYRRTNGMNNLWRLL